MERQPNKLWRKIGLQKNFLEGTSHSDLSQKSRTNSHQGSPFTLWRESHVAQNEQDTENALVNQLKMMRKYHESKDFNFLLQNQKKQVEKVESPISKLYFEDFDHNCKKWQQNLSNRADHENQVEKNVDKLLQIERQVKGQLRQKEDFDDNSLQYKSSDFEPSIKKSLCMNSLVEASDNEPSRYGSQFLQPPKPQPLHILHSLSQKNIECEIISSKQYQYQEAFVEDQRKRQSVQSQIIEVIECGQVYSISGVELRKYEKLHKVMIEIETRKLPDVTNKMRQIQQLQRQSHTQIRKCLKRMKQQLTVAISESFKSKILHYIQKTTQLHDQIAYLYEQNKSLMAKMNQKQQFIKKTSEQVQKMAETLSSIQSSKLAQKDSQELRQKDQLIESQQNEINRLYEKMEDLDELQNGNEFLKLKIHELEDEISRVTEGEFQLKRQFQEAGKRLEQTIAQLRQSQQKLSIKDQLIQSLNIDIKKSQQQLSQAYAKLDHIHFQLNGEYSQQLEKQQLDFANKIAQEKDKFRRQTQTIRQQIIQATKKEYHTVIEQMLKKISKLEVQNIIKKFNFHKDHSLTKIFHHATQSQNNLQSNHVLKLIVHNSSRHKLTIQDSVRIGQHADSDYEHSPTRNLKRTGFFGQASHSIINNPLQTLQSIKPLDIAKRYSTQRSQFNEDLQQYKTMYQTLTYQNNTKSKSKSPEAYSDKSYASLFKEDKASKSNFLTIHPQRNRQRSNSSGWQSKRQSSQIAPYTQNYPKDKILKGCQTKQQYLTSNDGHDISFTNSQHHYFDDPIKESPNQRYQTFMSQLNSPSYILPFQTSYASTNGFRSQKYSPEKNHIHALAQNSVRYKPYDIQSKDREEVDDIVKKIKQKINEKFKIKNEQSPVYGGLFKPTEFKDNKYSREPSPSIKRHSNTQDRPIQPTNFQKRSKNYSYGHSNLVKPSRFSNQIQQRSRSRSHNRVQTKSPSLDHKILYPITTPRGSVSYFNRPNNQSRQIHPAAFIKTDKLKEYRKVSPANLSPYKGPQTQRSNFSYKKH